jgi:hypothetical protein
VKNTRLDITIKKFMDLEPYYQRNMIINLLTYTNDDEIKYICYILYEILSIHAAESNKDEQSVYKYLPYKIKKCFKDIIKYTIQYKNEMFQKYDVSKIALEHQVYLLKVPDNIKEKAISKLKEIKGKPEENNSKSKQWIEGLLKIPFEIYKEEPILKIKKEINNKFQKQLIVLNHFFPEINITNIFSDSSKENILQITKKNKYTNIEIIHYIQQIEKYIHTNIFNKLQYSFEQLSLKKITSIVQYINYLYQRTNDISNDLQPNKENSNNSFAKKKNKKIKISNTPKLILIEKAIEFLKANSLSYSFELFHSIQIDKQFSLSATIAEMKQLHNNIKYIFFNIIYYII